VIGDFAQTIVKDLLLFCCVNSRIVGYSEVEPKRFRFRTERSRQVDILVMRGKFQ